MSIIFSRLMFHLRVVSEAAGADEFLQHRRTTRRTNGASTTGARETQVEMMRENAGSDLNEEDIHLMMMRPMKML